MKMRWSLLFVAATTSLLLGKAPSKRTDVGCYYGRVPTGIYGTLGYKFDTWFLRDNAQKEHSMKHWVVFGVSFCDTICNGFVFGLDMYGAILSSPNKFAPASLCHKYLFSMWQLGSMFKAGYCFPRIGVILYGAIGRNHIRGVVEKRQDNDPSNNNAGTNRRPQYVVWRFQIGGAMMIAKTKTSVAYEFQKIADLRCFSHGILATLEFGFS